MKSLTDDNDLINAGLLHYIYGTEGFEAFTVSLNEWPQITDLFGEELSRFVMVIFLSLTNTPFTSISLIQTVLDAQVVTH